MHRAPPSLQLARHFGAEVMGVCSTANVALVRSLGAHHVMDYTREDFTRNGEVYDVIVDTAGSRESRVPGVGVRPAVASCRRGV